MGAEGETRKDPERSAEGETRKDPAARCSVSDVVAKDIVPQNAYPGCQMGVAKRERDTKEDFHARSVAVVGMKPLLASFFVPMISCSLIRLLIIVVRNFLRFSDGNCARAI